ncbi:MAG: hypothetical protein ACREOG_18895 [Gemmatimonadaceae bacterium]
MQQQPDAPGGNPVLAGVKLPKGGTLGATSVDVDPSTPLSVIKTYHADGWEVDQRGAGTPPQAYATEALLAVGHDQSLSGQMLSYRTDMGGVVFAAASLNFGGCLAVDQNLQRIIQNVLDECLAC